VSEETGTMSEKALHILRAAVADARDEPGVYVSRVRVMEQTGVCDLEEFERIAEDPAERGFINQGVNRYEFFMVMLRGIGVGATEATPESREAPRRSRRMRIMARPPSPSRLFYPLFEGSYIRWQRSRRWRQTLPRQAPLPLLAL
jgi:hypothetical protein